MGWREEKTKERARSSPKPPPKTLIEQMNNRNKAYEHVLAHCIRRAKERYDLDVTADDIMRIETDISKGRARTVRINGEVLYECQCKGKLVRVGIQWGRVRTFLPRT